jgi:hypothetical protein
MTILELFHTKGKTALHNCILELICFRMLEFPCRKDASDREVDVVGKRGGTAEKFEKARKSTERQK